jgi:hypothetical protein
MYKNTIKEYLEEEIIFSELLSDNSFLVVTKPGNNTIEVKVRYMERNSVSENYLLIIKEDELDDLARRVIINQDKTFICTFTKEQDNYNLSKVYDLKDNSCIPTDFMDVIYTREFDNDKVNKKKKESVNKSV